MSNSHAKTANESFSTKQSNAEQVWEQLDLFEWAGIDVESPKTSDRIHSLIANDFWALVEKSGIFENSSFGFAVRSGL